MAKQLAYIQIRVEPVVSEPWGEETEEQHTRRVERIARELEEEIKRHCDNIGYITRFPYYECSHCGSAWETPPECCSEAVEETREKAKSSA